MRERTKLGLIVAVFLVIYLIPISHQRVHSAIFEALWLIQDYARNHVLTCLIPAFFIAGAISVFVSQASVIKYFGPAANKFLAYGVASVSGTILAVCSCTVLPLFVGIYKRGAGIGPASAFLYSGPAINVLAIILTGKVLGLKMGAARATGAILFSIIIGLIMAGIFKEEKNIDTKDTIPSEESMKGERSIAKEILYFFSMVCILVFASWSKPAESWGFFHTVYSVHWWLAGTFLFILFWMLAKWFKKDELIQWTDSTWIFAKQILPLLLAGVFAAGLLMGRPGLDNGLIPNRYIETMLGGNSFGANLFAAVAGALMYFATLTEIPILQGLIGSGMGNGPSLTLLLAGPALSLPSILVLAKVIGFKKTLIYILLVIVMSAIAGMTYGALF